MQQTSTRVTDGRPWVEPASREHHRFAWGVTGVVLTSVFTAVLAGLSLLIGGLSIALLSDGGFLHELGFPGVGVALWIAAAAAATGSVALKKARGEDAFLPRLAAWLLCAPIFLCAFWIASF